MESTPCLIIPTLVLPDNGYRVLWERRLIVGKDQLRLAAGAHRPRNDQFRSKNTRKPRKTSRFPRSFQATGGRVPEFPTNNRHTQSTIPPLKKANCQTGYPPSSFTPSALQGLGYDFNPSMPGLPASLFLSRQHVDVQNTLYNRDH
jgi:hypothetical protein